MTLWPYSSIIIIAIFCIGMYLLYCRGIAISKCIAAILFWFWPGKDSDQTTVVSCYGWIRHIGRFHESQTYEFVLDTQLSNGDVEVFLLDKEMQPLLKLTQWFPTGVMELDRKSKYYLQWEFSGATGRCELRWSAEQNT